MQNISRSEARKIILHSQKILQDKPFGKSKSAVTKAVQHLGYVQIDTIAVVERAHHHTLWNRVEHYKPGDIDSLYKSRRVFEHWDHALAILPIQDYRYCLPLMRRFASGETRWFKRDRRLMNRVLKRISQEGPLSSSDFEGKRGQVGGWGQHKPTKSALESLFMEGQLMVAYRDKFQKVYDLTERVLPEGLDISMPTDEELVRHLIIRFIRAQGLGKIPEFTYLRKGLKRVAIDVAGQMQEEGELIQLDIEGDSAYFTSKKSLLLLEKSLPTDKVKILSPFDNLVIQRKRLQALFNFDYQIECYVPEKKRKYGYFVLPVLWKDSFAARIDVKVSRADKSLCIRRLHLERNIERKGEFLQKLTAELRRFSDFNGAESLDVSELSNSKLAKAIEKAW